MKVDFALKCSKCGNDYIVQNVNIDDKGTMKSTIDNFVNSCVPCNKCGNDKKNDIMVLDIVWSKQNGS